MGAFVADIDAVKSHEYSDECQCEHCKNETMIQNTKLALDRTFLLSCHRLTVGSFLMELKNLGYKITETD